MDTQEPEFELVPGTLIGGSHPCYIIAEIGQNHQGDQRIAENLIKAAKEAGADCVKFQKSNLNSRFTAERLKQRYEGCNSFGHDYKEHKEKLELSERAYVELQNYASSIGIYFTASGMDKTYKDLFRKAVIGYSGHELGPEISIAAVAVGAKVLERHITLDRNLKGSDHCSSLDPSQFAQLVNSVRKIEKAMGSHEKKFLENEMFCYKKLGKTIVTSRDLPRGVPIEEDMIDVKVAVEVGMDPIMFYDIIGKCLKRDYSKEEIVKFEDLVDVITHDV